MGFRRRLAARALAAAGGDIEAALQVLCPSA
jgi:hypothetical protein